MLLVCPTCEASYQIDDSKIGSSGRTVRCKKCATVWFALKPQPEPEALQSEVAENSVEEPAAPQRNTPPSDNTDPVQFRADMDDPPAEDGGGWGDPVPDGVAQPAPDIADAARDNATDLARTADDAVDAPAIEHVAASSARTSRKGKGKTAAKRFAFPRPSGQAVKKMMPYAAFAACLLMVCAVALREPVARAMPWTGGLFAAMGLPVAATAVAIANVRSELSKLDKADVLIVEGELTNRGSRNVSVPPVRISVRDEAGVEIYSWSADVLKPTLAGGETSPFRARLASPPANGRSVAVRFGQAPAESPDKAAPKKS